jgi:hypothetical protein
MRSVLPAAVAYFAAVFAAGFVLGTVRVLALAPLMGEVAAVLVELPVMLAVSFLAARWAVGRHAVPPRFLPRLAMGEVAFLLLIAAEVALGLVAFGRSFEEVVAGMAAPAGLIGLAGQVVFGLMPVVLLAGRGGVRG